MFAFVLWFFPVLLPVSATADDNEIFGVVQQDVEPNILIIFDNSRSMESKLVIADKNEQECEACDWADWGCIREECTGRGLQRECECVEIGCVSTRMRVARHTVKNMIEAYGAENRFGIMVFHYNGQDRGTSGSGGYIPYHPGRYGTALEGRYAVCSAKDTFVLGEYGDLKTGSAYEEAILNYKRFLKDVVDDIDFEMYTPLAETLAEAGRYFAGRASLFNPDDAHYPATGIYPDRAEDDPARSVADYNPNVSHPPIGYWCRKNYIILMTDGEPTNDNASVLKDEPYLNGQYLPASGWYPDKKEGLGPYNYYRQDQPELQDIAGFLHDIDINSHLDGNQNILTYTIGFSEDVDEDARMLLQDTADRGMGFDDRPREPDGGFFFYATGEKELAEAFETIVADIREQDSVFAPVSVPVSDKNMAYAGDYAYVSMFRPVSGQSRWIGNLKKYRLNKNNEFASCDSGESILDGDGRIKDTALSCWTRGEDVPDGADVAKGGAGQALSETNDSRRRIYSNISGQYNNLSLPDNRFSKENGLLTADLFGVSDRDALIDKIRMAGEDWKLGDLNHSRPAVAAYAGGAEKYIFAGANDGMLHCFDDSDGSEKWAFVPREQFGRLKEAYTGDHSYFMDGSPTVADAGGRKIVICGERRGGRHYYAIDITDIENPAYLYTHESTGQSWKRPRFIETAVSLSSTAEGFLLTGGYDPAYDNSDAPQSPAGNAVYAIRASAGTDIFRFDSSNPALSRMTHSIVSAVAADTVDDGKETISRIYAGDLGGGLFAFRDNNDPRRPKALDGQWQALHLFSVTASGRKIFEEADFVREFMAYRDPQRNQWKTVTGDWVYFGTGDRANPLRTDTVNYFYCIKNDWHTGLLTTATTVGDCPTLNDPIRQEDDDLPVILDLTENRIQDGTERERKETREALARKSNRGWYIRLEHPGEKCLSAPVVYAGVVYFTTFTPLAEAGSAGRYDPCEIGPGGGTARLYALDYRTGAAVYDHFDGDEEDELSKDDRWTEIESPVCTIPASPDITTTETGTSVLQFPESERARDLGGVRLFYWKQAD